MASYNHDRFTMNIFDWSYFSGKLECYFRYKGIKYERNEVELSYLLKIYPNTGTMDVPTIYDKKNKKWLKDSTSIIEYMENDQETRNTVSILPTNKIEQFFCFLFEDFFDEWLYRTALYYRWNFDIDANYIKSKFSNEQIANDKLRFIRKSSIKWYMRQYGLKYDGISGDEQKKYIESQYIELLNILDKIFEERKYLFSNNYVSLADFGLFASMFRHFSLDPTPRKIMLLKAPNVYQWVARMWNVKHSKCKNDGNINKYNENILNSLCPLLKYIGSNYIKYLYLNEKAYVENKRYFDIKVSTQKIKQCTLNLPVYSFRVWCRRKLQQRFNKELSLNEKEQSLIEKILKECNCWHYLWKDTGFDDNKLNQNKINNEWGNLPFCKKQENISKLQWIMLWMMGKPHWMIIPKITRKFKLFVSLLIIAIIIIIYKRKRKL